ncbi:UDP-N-acetylmuramate dehydrogenase [Shewanella sp. D64]|uniref:UDP-N-acetylmuramate dehydrogenase n=1 Tax=unclassified Shewanella TaxID=196818 RepID=UPI0022BA4E30|nr:MULTISPECIES: UDP-N-acetylmuramate dehydrogenase [unclassified Shewanella]MEC4729080.1 UDP-N-acetylmuramate dehydrogenase [Shewanella sp. D64]MEC4740892.1 UDP-N-acetylmuramate dehydrogenase [Shewanella sp. E94]WBJ95282.1 UDP-N-acetylmuramate dehydrogenase [Shewanella sp. MTB7]
MPAKPLTSLKAYNTFAIDHACVSIIDVDSKEALIETCYDLYQRDKPFLLLGGGSNILLTEDYLGTVVRILTKGIKVKGDTDNYFITVEAGENWHELVKHCLQLGIAGLENLALIPGTVGAAPIQNIGAYGVEFVDVCDWVEYLDLTDGKLKRLNAAECRFGYRNSIFKGVLNGLAVITTVGFRLNKVWQPKLSYGPLQKLDNKTVTPLHVFDCICETRRSKLPDPKVLGNAGSFFKNPIITSELFLTLKQKYPDIVGYPVNSGIKLAAAWLIDNAGLKGFSIGKASVHGQQALVLVNTGSATGDDVVRLARYIIEKISTQFFVNLEAEPRVIGAYGEKELKDG